MSTHSRVVISALASVLATAVIGLSASVQASDAGAFIGGLAAAKIMRNMERRTEAQEAESAAVQRQAASHHSSSARKSPEARIKELDKLAAGGYITPEEYQAKKKAILDGI